MSEPKDLETLLARVTERRRELLTSVVNRRTRHFCMVLEDLFDPHNISAVPEYVARVGGWAGWCMTTP